MNGTPVIAFDWQTWLACGLGLLAVLHLTRRWWPKRHSVQSLASTDDGATACAVKAPGACGGGGCGTCGTATTPIRVHRRTTRDTLGRTPGP